MPTSESEYLESPPFTSEELADFIYNKKIPAVYRIADEEGTKKKDLYRFLQVGFQGGYTDTLEKAAMMKALVNPMTCPEEFLPYLFKSWGLPYFEDIGVYYNRKFLQNIGIFLKMRGTMGGTKYIIRALTGFDSNLTYKRVDTDEEKGRYLYVEFLLHTLKELEELDVSTYTVTRFLKEHLPFYIRVMNRGAVITQVEELENYNALVSAIGMSCHYNLVPNNLSRKIINRNRNVIVVNNTVHYNLSMY